MTTYFAKVNLVKVKLMVYQCALYLFNMSLDANTGEMFGSTSCFVGSKSSQKFGSKLLQMMW